MMAEHSAPLTPLDCAGLLAGVMMCLDAVALQHSSSYGDQLSLAAVHVQQAIELIESAEQTDA
jgi:hypothetical protein